MTSVRKSLFLQLLDSYVGLMLQIASAAIIARLLSPSEIGIFAVAAVLVAMASQFRDFGIGEYLIQERDLTHRKIQAAFAANVMVSWLVSVVLLGSSWWVAEFYRQPGVGSVMRVQAVNFIIVPFGAVTMAYFRRELQYRPMFIAGLCANLTSFAVAVGGALAGFSYMSMAWSSLAGLVVTVLVSLWFRPAHLPRWPALAGLRQVVAFSKHAMGIYFFGQIGKSAPEAVIGRILDVASVAFFSRANGLMEIFNRTVLRAALPICLPYFALSARAGEGTLRGYLKATTLITGVGWPFFLVIGTLSFSTIRLLYGPQWGAATQLAQILCLVAGLELPYCLAKEVMIAEGRIDKANRLQFDMQALRLVSLALVIPFGLLGACWGLVAATAAGGWIAQQHLHRSIKLTIIDLARACMPSAVIALITSAPVIAATLSVQQNEQNYLRFLILGAGTSPFLWVASLRMTRHPLWAEVSGAAAVVWRRWCLFRSSRA